MSMSSNFMALVRDLDPETLDQLNQSIAAEVEVRREKTAFQVENIHPGMTAAEREQAAQEIARVLRGFHA